MTAEEARQLTKAALINTTYLQNIDKSIVKAAKDGKYKATGFFVKSDGYYQSITKDEVEAIEKHYRHIGYDVYSPMSSNGKYEKIILDWSDEGIPMEDMERKEEILQNNVD
jgi:hypothetical protein